jgi:hypothetical protein
MNALFFSLHHLTGIVIVLNRNLLFPFAIQTRLPNLPEDWLGLGFSD